MKRLSDQPLTREERPRTSTDTNSERSRDPASTTIIDGDKAPYLTVSASPGEPTSSTVAGDTAGLCEDNDQKMPAAQRSESDGSQHTAGASVFLAGISSDLSMDLPEFVKRNNTMLTFPEKLMILIKHIEKLFDKSQRKERPPVEWVQDGHVVYIRDKDTLAKDWLPLFFQQTKFSSFTRKLYRWGFRQYSSPGEASKTSSSMYFFNENFQRNDLSLLSGMRSTTAAGQRREEATVQVSKLETTVNPIRASGQSESQEKHLEGNQSVTTNAGLSESLQPFPASTINVTSASTWHGPTSSERLEAIQALARNATLFPIDDSLQLLNQLQLLAQLRNLGQVDPPHHWPAVPSLAFQAPRTNLRGVDILERLATQNPMIPRQQGTLPTLLPRLVQQQTVVGNEQQLLQDALTRALLHQQMSEQLQLQQTSAAALGQGLVGRLDQESIIDELLTQLQRQEERSSLSDLLNRYRPP